MKKKLGGKQKRMVNPVAKVKYQLLDGIEAGVLLTGPEVKSLRQGRGSLRDSFVRVREGEAWIYNWQIPPYMFADQHDYDPGRPRKLLLHKKEIITLSKRLELKGWVAVPVAAYLKGNVYKVEVGMGRGKKHWERREELKRRDQERELKREFKEAQLK